MFDRFKRRHDSDHGAVAALVAVLLSAGVLFGSGALVIDVGLLYSEREQLQSGADAASFRIGMDCAKAASSGTPCTAGGEASAASSYAVKNALDGKANAQLCLSGSTCPSWLTTTSCPPLPTPPAGTVAGSSVEVRTSTLTSTNATMIPPVFGQTLPGINYAGTRVGACARVSWGPPANVGKVFSLGISLCDWKRMTSSGQNYFGPIGTLLGALGLYTVSGLPNPSGAGAVGAESGIPAALALTLAGLPGTSCTSPPDPTVPRGYVWLGDANSNPPDANCEINVNVGDWAHSTILTGLFAPQCTARLAALRLAKQPILVPIYDKIDNSFLNLNPGYHIVGFAPFVPTAYASLLGLLTGVVSTLSGNTTITNLLNTTLCLVGGCIYGYFTQTIVPMSRPTFGTGGYFGAMIVGRTG